MSDAISSSVEMNSSSSAPVVPMPMMPSPVGVPAVPAAGSPANPTAGAANDAPKPGSREAKRKEREAKAQAKAQARLEAKQAKQAQRDAEKAAKQKAREAKKAEAKVARQNRQSEAPVRAESSPEVWRAAFLAVATRASAVDDPMVATLLGEAEHAFKAFERDVLERPSSQAKVDALKAARKDLFTVFQEDLTLLIYALKSVRGGEEFVNAAKDDDKVTMARHLIARMTPAHLGQHKPQFEALKRSLEEYRETDRAYSELVDANAQANTRIADGKKLVQLAVSLLESAIGTAEARQALVAERKAQAERRRQEGKVVQAA